MIRSTAFLLATLALVTAASALAGPPAQEYVPNVGAAPLQGPATFAFTPGNSFTIEGWVFRTSAMPGGSLMGKGLENPGGDPYLGFGLLLDGNAGTRIQFLASTGVGGSFRFTQ